MDLLDGKVVIVTGGGHGIGRAFCLGIAREGGTAVVADIDKAGAQRVALEIKKANGKSLAVHTDVSNSNSCEALARGTLEAFGQIDGLINNAAIFLSVPVQKGGFMEIGEAEWDRVMAVNVKGVWFCSRAVAPAMRQRKQGSIVNISSNMVFNGNTDICHYVVSKAAVLGFSRVLARELGPHNIRVNTLAPGLTLSEENPTEETVRSNERVAASRVLQRVERPEDLVGTALYLVSDMSTFVTGQTLLVNGGAVFH